MELDYKTDFEETRAHWDAFWRGACEAPLVSCVVPRPGVEPVSMPPYLAGHDGDFEPVIDRVLSSAASHLYLGAAIPFFNLEFGPDHFSALLGCDLRFDAASPTTSWAEHWVKDWAEADIRFRPEGFWWQRTAAFIRALRRRTDGKLLIAAPTLVANLDALVALRGNEALMMDLIEAPEQVHRALDAVDRAYTEILDAFARELDMARYGSINRHGMYSRGRIAVPQCDVSCMISDAMFREFALPHLAREMAQLDAVEYHLDGPGALQHVDALGSLEKLSVIQWVPGAGEQEHKDWSALYRRIDDLGKGRLCWGDINSLQRQWSMYRSRQLFFHGGARNRSEAVALLAAAAEMKK